MTYIISIEHAKENALVATLRGHAEPEEYKEVHRDAVAVHYEAKMDLHTPKYFENGLDEIGAAWRTL